MFGFGNRMNRSRYGSNPGIFGGGIRRAAMLGLGMMAMRWWRNRNASRAARRPGPVFP